MDGSGHAAEETIPIAPNEEHHSGPRRTHAEAKPPSLALRRYQAAW